MQRSYEYLSSSYEYNSSSSSYYNVVSYSPIDEQVENIVSMQRMFPMMPQFPRFSSFNEVPENNSYVAEDKDHRRKTSNTNRSKKMSQVNHKKHHQVPDQVTKKVRFVVNGKKPDEDGTIDMAADRFIQQKRKNFDLCNNRDNF